MMNINTISWNNLHRCFEDSCEALGLGVSVDLSDFLQPALRWHEHQKIKDLNTLFNDIFAQNIQKKILDYGSQISNTTHSYILPNNAMIEEVSLCYQSITNFAIHNSYKYGLSSDDNHSSSDPLPPWLVCLIYFSMGSFYGTIANEPMAAFTKSLLGKPKQPNRDHHFGHIITVFFAGTQFLVNSEVMSNIVKMLPKTELFNAFMNDYFTINEKKERDSLLKEEQLKEIIGFAWFIVSLCHDSAYPLEAARWLYGNTGIEEWFKSLGFKDYVTGKHRILKIFKNATGQLKRIKKPKIAQYFINLFDKELHEDKITNHGPEMAVIMLQFMIKRNLHLKRNDEKWIILALFLAIEAIAMHSRLADLKTHYDKDIVKDLIKTHFSKYPLAVFLTSMDLLADANRVHWDILDYTQNKDEPEITKDMKRMIVKEHNLANTIDYSFEVNHRLFERRVLLGSIVGIENIHFEFNKVKKDVKISFKNALSPHKRYGYLYAENINKELYNVDLSVYELSHAKKIFLEKVLKEIAGIQKLYYVLV